MTVRKILAAAAGAPGACVPVGPPRTFIVCEAPGLFLLHRDAVPGAKPVPLNGFTAKLVLTALRAGGTWAEFVAATGLGTTWYCVGPAPA